MFCQGRKRDIRNFRQETFSLVLSRGLQRIVCKKECRVGRVFVGHTWAVLCTSTLQACNCVKLQAGHQGITHVPYLYCTTLRSRACARKLGGEGTLLFIINLEVST